MQKTIQHIILLRFRQIYRIVKTSGFVMLLFSLIITAGILLRGLEYILKTGSPVAAILMGFGLLSIHLNRKDRTWLKGLDVNTDLLFFVEYFLMASPFILLYIYLQKWWIVLLLLIACALIAYFNPPNSFASNWRKKLPLAWIPNTVFEFKSGLRKNFVPVVLVYVASLLSAFNIGAYFIGLILLGLLMISFFEEFEPKELIQSYSDQGSFLTAKAKNYALLIFFLYLPHNMLFLFFNIEYWYFVLLLNVLSFLLVLFCLYYKYAFYSPGRKRFYNSMGIAMFLAGVLVPIFLPGSLFMIIYYWRKAKTNLAQFYA